MMTVVMKLGDFLSQRNRLIIQRPSNGLNANSVLSVYNIR